MGRWDLYLKRLVWESPQDFVSLLLPGARYIRRREGQFQTRARQRGTFPTRELRLDGILEVEYVKQRILVNVEFQSTKDTNIGERLLGYSYEATRAHKLPVYSCVIYPRHVFEPPQAPYEWYIAGIGVLMGFIYQSLELAEMPLEELEQKQLVGLAPLLVCTKGGATQAVVERAITQLEAAHKVESLALLRLIATLVFEKSAADLAWLQWRFATMHDFLLENSIMYKELVKEGEIKGLEKGLEKGRAQGIKEGEMKGRTQGVEIGLRQSIEAVVQTRFPALLDLAKERLEHAQDQGALHRMLVALVAASTERKARNYLLTLNGNT